MTLEKKEDICVTKLNLIIMHLQSQINELRNQIISMQEIKPSIIEKIRKKTK